MARINARGIVAFMKNVNSGGYLTDHKFIGEPMCIHKTCLYVEMPISKTGLCSCPFPAFVGTGYFNFSPETTVQATMELIRIGRLKRNLAEFTRSWSKMKSHVATSLSNMVRGFLQLQLPESLFNINNTFESQEV